MRNRSAISRTTITFVVLLTCLVCLTPARAAQPTYWPPRLDQYYPNLTLYDIYGRKTTLDSLKGKVLVIEPIGMSCPACQAFCGANKPSIGPYGRVVPQQGLVTFEDYLASQGVSCSDSRVVFVQLLLYNPAMKAPSLSEGRAWAQHFRVAGKANHMVLVGDQSLVNQASYNMIPGFQLVDANFVLRFDSTGHSPRQNLYTHLVPMLKQLLR